MKSPTYPSALALLLAAAFAWSDPARGVDCACEVATGTCTACCGAQNTGFKHCETIHNGSTPPPAVMSLPGPKSPDFYESAPAAATASHPAIMNSPDKKILNAPKSAKKQPAADYRDGQGNKKDKTKPSDKSAAPKQAPDTPGKDLQ